MISDTFFSNWNMHEFELGPYKDCYMGVLCMSISGIFLFGRKHVLVATRGAILG